MCVIGGQLTLRACMTTSWASSSPSKILRRVSSSALLRASTFIFSSWGDTDRERLRERICLLVLFMTEEEQMDIKCYQNDGPSQGIKMLLGIVNGFMCSIALNGGLSCLSAFFSEWHRADMGWDSGSHLWPHWVVLRVINRKSLAYLHVKLPRDPAEVRSAPSTNRLGPRGLFETSSVAHTFKSRATPHSFHRLLWFIS